MNFTHLFGRAFISFVPFGVVITGVCLMSYFGVQQAYRQGLNDPQIQMAEDAAAKWVAGENPTELLPSQVVDIKESLSPWLAFYDKNGAPIASSGMLNNSSAELPKGLFDVSTWTWEKVHEFPTGDETRVTWQSKEGVRQAVVLAHVEGKGFVAAGRNMRAVEERISEISRLFFIAWLFVLGATFITLLVSLSLSRKAL
jgi:hypothetical protein